MLKKLLVTTALAAPILAMAAPANALLSIAFQANGAGPVSTCTDGAACDNGGQANQIIQFNQVVGQFVLSGVLTESSKSSGGQNSLDLTSLVITNTGGAGFLTIVAGDTGFFGPVTALNESASGTFKNNVGATATLSFFADPLNQQPAGIGLATPGTNTFNVASTATQVDDSQSGTQISAFFAGGSYSMAERAVLQFNAGGSVVGFSEGMQAVAVPGPRAGSFTIGGLLEAVDELWKSKATKKKCTPYGDEPQMCG